MTKDTSGIVSIFGAVMCAYGFVCLTLKQTWLKIGIPITSKEDPLTYWFLTLLYIVFGGFLLISSIFPSVNISPKTFMYIMSVLWLFMLVYGVYAIRRRRIIGTSIFRTLWRAEKVVYTPDETPFRFWFTVFAFMMTGIIMSIGTFLSIK